MAQDLPARDAMHAILIHLFNGIWMVLVLVGVPAVTSLQFGKVQLSAVPEFQMLTLGGFGIGTAANILGGCIARGKRRSLWWKWAFVQGGLLLVYYLLFNRYIQFQWLKSLLLWLKRTVS